MKNTGRAAMRPIQMTFRIESFHKHLLTHKTAQAASFFGTGGGVMSESSDYFESASPTDRVLLPPEEIRCVLALQYLLGVRDFCFLFRLDRFAPEEYREICDFVAGLLEQGNGGTFRPECALYYPIEQIWAKYVPTYPAGDLCCAGINTGSVGMGSEELLALDRLVTETAKRLFYANTQYVLCERPDVGKLRECGVTTLVYFGLDEPEEALRNLCLDLGIALVRVEDFETARRQGQTIRTGPHVVYATYDRFVFAVNTGREASHIEICGRGITELPALTAVFVPS